MGKVYQGIDQRIKDWLLAQPLFFVATSPLSGDGHINVSPKGLDTFRIIDPHTVAYADYGGSGIETVAHLRENQRIVLMACAFQGKPKIVRLHGKGYVIFAGDTEFDELLSHFKDSPVGVRALIKIAVTRVSDSCGYGVPLMAFQQQRDTSIKYMENAGDDALRDYFKTNNRQSIDGLPGLTEEQANAYRGVDELKKS